MAAQAEPLEEAAPDRSGIDGRLHAPLLLVGSCHHADETEARNDAPDNFTGGRSRDLRAFSLLLSGDVDVGAEGRVELDDLRGNFWATGYVLGGVGCRNSELEDWRDLVLFQACVPKRLCGGAFDLVLSL